MKTKLHITIFNILKKYHILIIVTFILCTYSFSAKNIYRFRGNEKDVLVVAKHFMNPNWIPNDWYLNLDIGYRYLFNTIAGSMALIMPLYLVGLIGRLIIAVLFSYVIYKLSNIFNLKIYIILFFLYLWFNYFESIAAGEWMLKGFETKCFSYIFLLLSLIYLYKKNYFKMFLFSGLSLSFHVLIGMYSIFCLILTILININYQTFDYKKYIKYFYIFFITGSIGIFSIFRNIFDNQGVDKKYASLIYIYNRVSHHLLPTNWSFESKIELIVFLLVLFFIFLFMINDKRFRIFSSYALTSTIFLIIGLLLYKLNKIELLKFYWFRFPDVILPFFSIFLFFCLLQRYIYITYLKFKTIRFPFKIISKLLSIIVVIFFSGPPIKEILSSIKINLKNKKNIVLYDKIETNLNDILIWINKNTPKDSVILSYPFIEEIYIITGRATFISFKHSPSSEKDILEWYHRFILCNDDNKFNDIKYSNIKKDVSANFYKLRTETINKIVEKYKISYYLGKINMNYPFKIIYQNKEYALYLLK